MQLGGSYLKFSVLLLDCGERENIMLLDHVKRKKMISCSILFVFYVFFLFLLFFKTDENNFNLFSKSWSPFHFVFRH